MPVKKTRGLEKRTRMWYNMPTQNGPVKNKGGRSVKKWVFLAVSLGWIALIFWFSAQPGSASGALSNQVADSLSGGASGVFTPAWFSQNVYANVRKWAHIYIYAALGASVMLTVHAWLPAQALPRQGLVSLAICAVYAATDELHQYFVPGRAMLLGDIWVDSLGAAVGIGLIAAMIWLHRKHR